MRLRSISSQFPNRAFRQERVEADYAGQATPNGGAIISTRDSVAVGFGLEQVTDPAVRNELVRRVMAHLLPTTADTVAPTVSWLRPDAGATVNVADPVEIEVEAADERGDIKEARLTLERHARADEGVLPVPDALAADGRRRGAGPDAHGHRRGQGGQHDHDDARTSRSPPARASRTRRGRRA